MPTRSHAARSGLSNSNSRSVDLRKSGEKMNESFYFA